MKIKTILIVVLTALITIILMKNTDSVEFWIFGVYYIQKLVILATMFIVGVIVGLIMGRGGKKKPVHHANDKEYDAVGLDESPSLNSDNSPTLSEEDRNYIR